MNMQKITSANTSINNSKLPTAFTKFAHLIKGSHVCDYGCGKYVSHICEHVWKYSGLTYNPYDPYNQQEIENSHTLIIGKYYGFDLIFCCNVLNVIDSEYVIKNVLHEMKQMLKSTGTVIIQIYEGNKSGIGKQTKKDCYQRNWKTAQYLNLVFEVFSTFNYIINITGNYITIKGIDVE